MLKKKEKEINLSLKADSASGGLTVAPEKHLCSDKTGNYNAP